MAENKAVVSSFIWKFIERGAAQVFALIVQIILARLLAPQDFGILAILLIFVNVSNVLIQKGIATALVQKEHVEDIDINTALWFSEAIALMIFIFLLIIAPIIENIYKTLNLAAYLRVIALSLFVGAFYSIENSLLIRSMQFKKMFFSSFAATIIAGVLAIILAFKGIGCWALIWQNLVQQSLLAVFSFPCCRWRIKGQYSKVSFYNMFRFGSSVLLAELLYTIVENLRTFIIGAKYSAVELAYYDRGQTYPSVAMRSIYDTVGSVLLPIFSRNQSDIFKLKQVAQMALGFSFFLVAPFFIGFSIIAEPFTRLLLTNKWLDCVPYIQIFCIYQLGILPYCILRNILYATGKSQKSLVLEFIKVTFSLGAVLIGVLMNIFAIALFSTVAVWISTFAYGLEVHKQLCFDLKRIFSDFARVIISCFVMSISILFVDKFISSLILKIVFEVLVGGGVYILMSLLINLKYMMTVLTLLKVR